MAARARGDNDFGQSIFATPYELLKGIARETGGKDYADLIAAIKRLSTTSVETTIRGGKSRFAIAIGHSCIRGGARGRFFNVVDLVNRLVLCLSEIADRTVRSRQVPDLSG